MEQQQSNTGSGAVVVDSRFRAGMTVEAYDMHNSNPSRWRKALLMKHAPYPKAKTDGYYIHWSDMAGNGLDAGSQGGWHSVKTLRPVEEVQS